MSPRDLERKSDTWLGAALFSEDLEERTEVRDYLLARYGPEISGYLRRRVPPEYVEQAIQETWMSFYHYLQDNEVRENIGGLLQVIAQRRRADIFRMIYKEHRIESDLPDVAADVENVGYDAETDERLEYLLQLPYGDSFLAPCERLMLALEVQYKLPREVIGRLLGKSGDTINTHNSMARKKIRRRIQEHSYRPRRWRENPFVLRPQHTADEVTLVEQFAVHFMPDLSPEELNPIGIELQELKENYVASLLVPRWKQDDSQSSEYGRLALLLVQSDEMKEWKSQARKAVRNPRRRDIFFPEACMVELDIDNGFLDLSVQTLVDVMPDLDPPDYSDRTMLSIHKPFGMIPVTFGFWDPELFLEPELNNRGTAYDRWPFLPDDTDWVDRRYT